jgi:hypothetical protein
VRSDIQQKQHPELSQVVPAEGRSPVTAEERSPVTNISQLSEPQAVEKTKDLPTNATKTVDK